MYRRLFIVVVTPLMVLLLGVMPGMTQQPPDRRPPASTGGSGFSFDGILGSNGAPGAALSQARSPEAATPNTPAGRVAAAGTPTRLTVRVIAKGGKFLGADIGGARVTVRDADTGAILATGVTSGGSGDTAAIMTAPRSRETPIPTDGASAFTTSLPLAEPAHLEVTAEGPLAGLQSIGRASATVWLVPGHDLTGGDGLLLELPGLLVQVMEPATHTDLTALPQDIPLVANVGMMCGCPIAPGGPWPPEDFEVGATVRKDGAVVAEIPLAYTGPASRFGGVWTVTEPGFYVVDVYAYQPATGNTGVGRVAVFTSLP